MHQVAQQPSVPPVERNEAEAAPVPASPCPVCARLLNLYLTGEWVCPRCGGPAEPVAEVLRSAYVLRGTRPG